MNEIVSQTTAGNVNPPLPICKACPKVKAAKPRERLTRGMSRSGGIGVDQWNGSLYDLSIVESFYHRLLDVPPCKVYPWHYEPYIFSIEVLSSTSLTTKTNLHFYRAGPRRCFSPFSRSSLPVRPLQHRVRNTFLETESARRPEGSELYFSVQKNFHLRRSRHGHHLLFAKRRCLDPAGRRR